MELIVTFLFSLILRVIAWVSILVYQLEEIVKLFPMPTLTLIMAWALPISTFLLVLCRSFRMAHITSIIVRTVINIVWRIRLKWYCLVVSLLLQMQRLSRITPSLGHRTTNSLRGRARRKAITVWTQVIMWFTQI